MAKHIARRIFKYTRNALSYNSLFTPFSIENRTLNAIFCRSSTLSGSKRLLSNSVNTEGEEREDKWNSKLHKDRIEEVTRVKPQQFEISFEEYIKLKNSVRTKQRVAGMPFALLGLGTSSVVSAYMFPEMFDATPENVQLIMGLDPLVFCGICGVVSAGAGYAVGTQLFKTLWKVLNGNQARVLLEREKDFLERIQKARFASFSKFEDDYYGESIKNLSDYRQWLRTQQKKAKADQKFSGENEAMEEKNMA